MKTRTPGTGKPAASAVPDVVDDRYRIHQCTRDEFLAFSIDAAVAGLSRAT